jgi:hypothetical protein
MRTSTTYSTLTAIIFLLYSFTAYSNTIISSSNGNWANSSTWDPPGTPMCGDSVVIRSSHTVSITNQQNYNTCAPLRMVIYGTLKFMNGSKLSLSCGSYIIVKPGGKIEADVGLSSSNFIEICNTMEWNSNAPLNGPACLPSTHTICAYALSVEISGFTAVPCNNKICLNWQTSTETDNRYFELQRSSDGIYFEAILQQESRARDGNSHSRIDYEAFDASPLAGVNYYRLKQVDINGSYSYSKLLSVQYLPQKGISFLVFPSVTSGDFSAQLKGSEKAGSVIILVRNAYGEIVHKAWNYITDPSEPVLVSPRPKLPNGVYYCSFLTGNEEYNMKVVVSETN